MEIFEGFEQRGWLKLSLVNYIRTELKLDGKLHTQSSNLGTTSVRTSPTQTKDLTYDYDWVVVYGQPFNSKKSNLTTYYYSKSNLKIDIV